ncbi:MAG: glycosyltransferase [Cytophagales bacterium]|nr:MAG: glycosyltransferase [Cytophagales bacterium]
MTKKKIIFTVTNDLVYDQRMQRICGTLAEKYDVTLIGRVLKNNQLTNQLYNQKRFDCYFSKGKLFYAEINLRIFFFLLFSKVDIIGAIDLDTIVPAFLVSKLRNKTLVYDAHEYYTQVIELIDRPLEQSIWLKIEEFILPKVKHAYTVSESLQKLYTDKYNIPFELIRNIAPLKPKIEKTSQEKYLIYIGAVNAGRGISELLYAMKEISLPLHICGEGDLLDEMKQLSIQLNVQNKVVFHGNVLPEPLRKLTANAFAGFLLLENKGLSYYYSLANKFFDYIHGEIPQITINFPEYQLINNQIEVALLIDLQPNHIVAAVNKLINDPELYRTLKDNCKIAKHEYSWQTESQRLISYYEQIK